MAQPRIVVVEDGSDIGSLVESMLGREDVDVVRARSGREALDALERTGPDPSPLVIILTGGGPVLQAGPIRIALDPHEVTVSGDPLHLTSTEFKLLADLVRNQGRVRTRDRLMSEVWGYESRAMSRTVDTHVRRLRKKLGPAAAWLTTVRGAGYLFRRPAAG